MSIFCDQQHFLLYSQNRRHTKARLHLKGTTHYFPCVIGKNGQTSLKREGDNKTPMGTWRPLKLYYRADRINRPQTKLPIVPINPTDGWCDEPFDPNYNRPVKRPYQSSSEALWRKDHIYDCIIVLDHNQKPRIHGLGSAIFIHLARKNYTPTEGCIALSKKHLTEVAQSLSLKSTITI